jgi:hypothetical protein
MFCTHASILIQLGYFVMILSVMLISETAQCRVVASNIPLVMPELIGRPVPAPRLVWK